MADIFQQLAQQQRERDPFVRLAQANKRQSENYNVGLISDANYDYRPEAVSMPKSPTEKSVGDYVGDLGVDLADGAASVGDAAVGLLDLGWNALGKVNQGYQNIGSVIAPSIFGETQENAYTSPVADATKNFRDNAHGFWQDLYSDGRKRQDENFQLGMTEAERQDYEAGWKGAYGVGLQQLQAGWEGKSQQQRDIELELYNKNFDKGLAADFTRKMNASSMSTDKSFGENLSALGDSFANIADAPSIGVGAAIGSIPSMIAGGAIGKGAGAVGSRLGAVGLSAEQLALRGLAETGATKLRNAALQASVGEGAVMAGSARTSMADQSINGILDDSDLAATALIGAGGAAIGRLGAKLGGRLGIDDADVLAAGVRTSATEGAKKLNQAARIAGATAIEAGEEGLQSTLETTAQNIAQGKDAFNGLNNNVALGMVAGGLMGGVSNAPEAISAGVSSISSGIDKATTKVKDKVKQVPFEDLSNVEHEQYNPAQAYLSQIPDLSSENADTKAQAQSNIDKVTSDITKSRQDALDQFMNLNDQLEEAKSSNNQALKDLIPELEQGVKESGQRYNLVNSQYLSLQDEINKVQDHEDTAQGNSLSSDQVKEVVSTIQTTPEDQVTPEIQQESVDNVRKLMSTFDADELQSLASNTHMFTPEQRDSLRQLAEVKVAQNMYKDIGKVRNDILNGQVKDTPEESHRSIDDYTRLVDKAVQRNNPEAVDIALADLDRWAVSHTNKAEVLTAALNSNEVKAGGRVQVVNVGNGQWSIITDPAQFIPNPKENGAWTVHKGSNKKNGITAVVEEAEMIRNAQTALENYASAFSFNTAVDNLSEVPPQEVPQQVDENLNDSVQSPEITTELGDTNDQIENDTRGVRGQSTRSERTENTATNDTREASNPRQDEQSQEPRGNDGTGGSSTRTSGQRKTIEGSDYQGSISTDENGETQTWYHGTAGDFEKFDLNHPDRKDAGWLGTGVYLTDSEAHANRYADLKSKRTNLPKNVMHLNVDASKFLQISLEDKAKLMRVNDKDFSDAFTKWAKDQGYEGVIVDHGLDYKREIVVFNPDQVTRIKAPLQTEVTAKVPTLQNITKQQRLDEQRKSYKERDMIKAHFDQKSEGKHNPLVLINNFASQLKDNVDGVVKQFTGKTINATQHNQIQDFTEFNTWFSGLIAQTFRAKPDGVKYQDFTNFLVNEQGQLDENTLTALSLSAYSWIIEKGGKSINTDDEIRDLLHLDEDAVIPQDVAEIFRKIGNQHVNVIYSLGQKASQMLGLKVRKDSKPTLQSRLDGGLGGLIYYAMINAGLIKTETLTGQEMADIAEAVGNESFDSTKINKHTVYTYARPDFDLETLEPSKDIQKVIDASKGTKGILSDLFSNAIGLTAPLLQEPESFAQENIRKTKDKVPSQQASNVDKAQKNSFTMRKNTVELFQRLMNKNPDYLYKLLDIYVDDATLAKEHISDRDSVEAAARNEQQRLKNGLDFVSYLEQDEDGNYQPFWDAQHVQQNKRMYYTSNMFNIQSGQIHRAMAGLTAFKSTISLDKLNDPAEWRKYQLFLLGAAEGMEGIEDYIKQGLAKQDDNMYRFGTVDKVASEHFLEVLEDYLSQDYVVEAIASMSRMLKDKATNKDAKNVQNIVSEWGMGVQSLQSLIHITELVDALESNTTEFTTDIAVGSDGINNGVASANILLGTANPLMSTQVGMIPKVEDQVLRHMQDVYEFGITDYYTSFGAEILKTWDKIKSEVDGKAQWQIAQIESMDRLFKGFTQDSIRKIAKAWAVPFNYNAGFPKLNAVLTRTFISGLHKQMVSIADKAMTAKENNDTTAYQEAEALAHVLATDLNNILPPNLQVQLPKPELLKEWDFGMVRGEINFSLQRKMYKQIEKTLSFTQGKAATQATKSFASQYISMRNMTGNLEKLSFKLSQVLRQKLLDVKLQELKDEGRIDNLEFDGLSQQEITHIDEQIKQYAPVVKTALSVNSTNALESGVEMVKRGKQIQEVDNNNRIGGIDIRHHNLSTGKSSGTLIGLSVETEQDMGVGGVAALVQSIDAAVSSMTIGRTPSTNIHDQNSSGISDFEDMTKTQNQAYLDYMTTYHMATEHLETVVRTLQGIVDLGHKSGLTQDELETALYEILKDKTEMQNGEEVVTEAGLNSLISDFFSIPRDEGMQYTSITEALRVLVNTYSSADINKLIKLSNTQAVHQYGGEGGAITLNDEHHAEIDKQLKEVQLRNAKLGEQLTTLSTQLKDITNVQSEVEVKVESKKLDTFGRWLEDRKNDPIPFEDLMKVLNKEKLKPQLRSILDTIKNLMPPNLEINYFDGANIPAHVDASGINVQRVHAWYDTDLNTINIKSVDSYGSKVNHETFVHEMLHAALALRIQEVQANPEQHAEAKEHIDRLENLRQQMLDHYIGDTKKLTEEQYTIRGMLENLDEFISYGLTEPTLQKLMQAVVVPTDGRVKSKLKSMYRSFVEAIAGVLGFRSKNITALNAFVYDSAMLMQSAANVPVKPTVGMLFSRHSFNDPHSQVRDTDTIDVFKQLNAGQMSQNFEKQLDALIDNTLRSVYNNDAEAKTGMDQIVQVPTSDAVVSGFNLSEKEEYVQQAVQLVVETYMKSQAGTMNVSQLRKSFDEAKSKLTVKDFHQGDWSTTTQEERDFAERKYDALFDAKKPNYLSNFISMVLSSEDVQRIVGVVADQVKIKKGSWFDRITSLYDFILSWITDKYVHLNPSDPVSKRIRDLVTNLTNLDIKARQKQERWYEYVWNLIGKVTTPLNNNSTRVTSLIFDRAFFKENRFKTMRVIGKLAALTPKNIAEEIPNQINAMRNKRKPQQRLGEVMEFINEISSPSALRNIFDGLVRTASHNAQDRQSLSGNTKKAILSAFKDHGKHLTKEQHKAVTYGLLRSDVQSLVDHYGADTVVDLLTNIKARHGEVTELENEILQDPNGNDMLIRAKKLAYYMITNKGGNGLVKNPVSIASGIETSYQSTIKDESDPLVQALDKLVSLYALDYVPKGTYSNLSKMATEERDALKQVIQLHTALVEDAKKDFSNNPLSYTKGYMPEVVNPYREIKVAESKSERNDLEKFGWKFISQLEQDPMDTKAEKYLMIHSDRGYQRIVSGAVDLMNTKHKGTQAMNRSHPDFIRVSKQREQSALNRAKQSYKTFDPSKDTGLIASYDADGLVLSYNYEMSNHIRDEYLERNHNFADLLGSYAGMNYYKPANGMHSMDVAEVIFKDYQDNYRKDPRAYVFLSPNSANPKDVELWRMLPHEFRQAAQELFGKGKPIAVRNDILNIAFGYKKYSLAQMFDKVSGTENTLEKIFIGFMRSMFGNNAQAQVAKIEHIVQEIVRFAKDIIVIRSVSVLWGNIVANTLMLLARGINPIDIGKRTAFALTNARRYQKTKDHLQQLEAKLTMGGNMFQLEQQIAKAQDDLKRNPLAQFIEAGMLSSIVEDVAIQQGDYTYTTEFKQRVDEWTKWIPSPVKTAAQWLTVSPNTAPYQFLATTTQLSDFVAKFILFEHIQTKEKLSFEDATTEASRTFINYDVPTGKGMQYMNDMGLFMFTKFFLRFQSVLLRQLDKRAASVIGQHMATEMLTDATGILDPLMINRLGNNPFEGSAFNIFNAVGEIPTVNVVF